VLATTHKFQLQKHSLQSASAVLCKQSKQQCAANLNEVDPTATAVFHKLESMPDCVSNNTFKNESAKMHHLATEERNGQQQLLCHDELQPWCQQETPLQQQQWWAKTSHSCCHLNHSPSQLAW